MGEAEGSMGNMKHSSYFSVAGTPSDTESEGTEAFSTLLFFFLFSTLLKGTEKGSVIANTDLTTLEGPNIWQDMVDLR